MLSFDFRNFTVVDSLESSIVPVGDELITYWNLQDGDKIKYNKNVPSKQMLKKSLSIKKYN